MRVTAPFQQAERRHDADDGRQRHHAERETDERLPYELPTWRAITETHTVGELHAARYQDEANEQGDHPDPLTNAVKGEIEMRM